MKRNALQNDLQGYSFNCDKQVGIYVKRCGLSACRDDPDTRPIYVNLSQSGKCVTLGVPSIEVPPPRCLFSSITISFSKARYSFSFPAVANSRSRSLSLSLPLPLLLSGSLVTLELALSLSPVLSIYLAAASSSADPLSHPCPRSQLPTSPISSSRRFRSAFPVLVISHRTPHISQHWHRAGRDS